MTERPTAAGSDLRRAATSPDLTDADGSRNGDADTVEIREDIEETRVEMGATLGELGDRLDPSRVMQEAKENVREATIGRVEQVVEDAGETARGTSDMVINTIKDNPIPSALAATGLFMLWRNRAKTSGAGDRHADRRGIYDDRYGTRYFEDPRSDRSPGDTVRQVGSNAAGTVSDAAGNVASSIGDVAGTAGQKAGEVVEQGRQTAGQLGSQLDRYMHASPLAMGAIAYGVGAVVGALVPETEPERQILSKPAEQVSTAVRDTVDEAMDKVDERAEEAQRELTPTL